MNQSISELKESSFSKSVLKDSENPTKILTESLGTLPGCHISLFNSKFSRLCFICNIPIIEFHHIVPMELDGEDISENIIPLCPTHHTQIHVLINRFHKNRSQKITKRIYREAIILIEYIKRYEPKLYQFYWDITESAINTRKQEVKGIIKLVKKDGLPAIS